MKTSALDVFIETENELPPYSFVYPEAELSEQMLIVQLDTQHEACQYAIVGCLGQGRLMRYGEYHVYEPVTFYSIPDEPVVALHIQIEHEAYCRYAGTDDAQQLWPEDQCRLFWQGEQVVEMHMLPGAHTQLDLFFRPEAFAEIAERPVLKQLLAQVQSIDHGTLDYYTSTAAAPVEEFLMELFNELMDKDNKPTVGRLHDLTDYLLLLCLGETVEVAPPPPAPPKLANATPPQPEVKHYEPSDDEREFLADIAEMDSKRLKREFEVSQRELTMFSESLADDSRDAEALLERHAKAIAKSVNNLADAYLVIARSFSNKIEQYKWNKTELAKLKKAILTACDNAFDLRMPSEEELDFYEQWAPGPRALSGPSSFGLKEFSLLLGSLPGVKEVDYSGVDDTPEGRALFEEKMLEQFGFVHMSQLKGETEKDKPIEVVQLYHHLMTEVADSMTVTDDGTVTRSDIVRLLDHAYEYNDYLSLLRLELKYLAAKDAAYLAKQDDEKIRWYIVAIQMECDQICEESQNFRKTEPYLLLEQYRGLGGDEAAFNKLTESHNKLYRDLTGVLEKIYGGLDKKVSKSHILEAAGTMMRFGQGRHL